jgi:hypothetical protein
MVAPDFLGRPVEMHLLYQRDRRYVMGGYNACVGSDRALNPTTG